MAKITMGYWDIRGIAEPIRYLLHYKQVDFEDKRYTFHNDEWDQDKFNLGLDFPNLPYLFDGDIKLTQSSAILRYLAQKYNMDGNTRQEKVRVSLAEQQLYDLRFNMIQCVYNPDFEHLKDGFVKNAPAQFKQFETFLGDRKFLAGDNVTYVDFMLSEIFDYYTYLIPELVREFPTLKAHHDRVVSLPELQKYLNSSTYRRWPLFGLSSKFGGSGEEPKRD